jgi:hypothetical protein
MRAFFNLYRYYRSSGMRVITAAKRASRALSSRY